VVIHQLLHLARPIFVLDTETTGTDPQQDRIVEIAFEEWTSEGMVKEWRSLVDPRMPIPAAETKVHGITNNDMVCCRECRMPRIAHPYYAGPDPIIECPDFKPVPTFPQLAANLAKGFADCDFAGQNVRFDLQILAAEMARAKQPWSYATARIVDSSALERLAVPRSLSHLHEKYAGAKHDGAHGALSDVRAAATVIAKQLEAHELLPRDLDALHELQWPGLIDAEGKFKMVDGVPTVNFGKWKGKAMKDVDAGYWDFILREGFSDGTKKLAAEAKRGVFPEGR
jgi:DNA polymerase-3 subunit epsilon